jgi:acyl-[acyl-carrier-protein]-phospholipid O-acyltransferase/long-chain-fatty-acid--[acyl-carrier-protein] ligase
MEEEDLTRPTTRNWISFWSLASMQFAQAFNVNASKFILIALGAWLLQQGQGHEGIEHIITLCLVIPYVLFAPTCGWISDRYAKSSVVRWTSWLQIVALLLIALAIHQRHIGWAVAGYFLVATQAALISPSKLGVVKEYVGGKRLGFASGVMEGTVILAILAGQIIGARWFDDRLGPETGGYEAAIVPLYWLVLFALISVVMAHLTQRSVKHPTVPLSWKVATSHVKDLREFFGMPSLKLCGLGVGFFWGFGGFIALAVLQIAETRNGGGGKGAATAFANLWAMAVIGIAVGSVIAGILSRKRIEMGLTPIGGILMTGGTIALAFTPHASLAQQIMLVIAGAGGAAFLVPLQAVLQDAPAEDKRGMVISASNLLNNLFGIATTALQFVLKYAGVAIWIQFLILGGLALFVTLIAFRHLGSHVIRLVGLMVIRAIYRIRVTGETNVPKTGGALLLPNHVTWADAFFISAACPRPVRFVMDETFMTNPWVARFSKIFQTVPIDRESPREALRITAEALKEGHVLCLFPEGQLTRTGGLNSLQRGFELIGRMAKCPLVPVWVDGSWGSIFSFESGRYFKKRPTQVPYELSVAFGEPLDAGDTDTRLVRNRMLEASAAAIETRFSEDPPLGESINGYQIGQLETIPRRGEYSVVSGDPLADQFAGSLISFMLRFQSWYRDHPEFTPSSRHWIGGEMLRDQILTAPAAPIVFFDFSKQAITPIEKPGLIHCPCLAVNGIVVAMSVPDPQLAGASSEPQRGRKAGSWGRLLPGFYTEADASGSLRVFGPAAPKEGILLPAGTTLDDECFVMAPIP